MAAAAAGAAIVHIHVRDPETRRGSREVALYAEVVKRLRAANCPALINLTAGMGGKLLFGPGNPVQMAEGTDLVDASTRLVHVEALRPEMCSLDCGSFNSGLGDEIYVSTGRRSAPWRPASASLASSRSWRSSTLAIWSRCLR
ncbi:hypothetical protein MASR1M32_38690 [Rhodobacter sp.]